MTASVNPRIFFAVPLDFLLAHEDLARRERVNAEVFADGDALEMLDDGMVSAARALLDEAGARRRVHGPISEIALGAFDPRIREVSLFRCRQSLRLAAALGAEAVVIHSGFDILNKRDQEERYFEAFSASLRAIAAEAARTGLRLLVENTFEPSPAPILGALESAGAPNTGLVFDVAHHRLYGRTPLDEWLSLCAGLIEEVHVTDNDGDWDYHLAPGKGGIDLAGFFDAMARLSLRPVITFEPRDLEAFAETTAFIRAHPAYFA